MRVAITTPSNPWLVVLQNSLVRRGLKVPGVCYVFSGVATTATNLQNIGGGGTHILRHTGTFGPFGSVFCKKFLDMSTTFH